MLGIMMLAAPVAFATGEYEFGAQYTGRDSCRECHRVEYDQFMKSGHAYKLNKVVDGQPPRYPFTEVKGLPKGITWNDVTYVIGGYNWKARFIGKDGFIITGPEGDSEYLAQYNFPNPVVGTDAHWVTYNAGKKKAYDCGPCHTTGYNAAPGTHQHGLPGLIGTWAEPGISCERCHGPGSLHVANPHSEKMEVNRDAELCGECHIRGSIEQVNASGGFIQHHEQYEELFQSKHVTLDCSICHDPHLGVIQLRKEGKPAARTECANCHFQEAKYEDSQAHVVMEVQCIDCHMPRVTKSAVGDAKKFTGDLRTHMMGIDALQIEQFTADGKNALSQIGLNFACRSCHAEGGKASVKTDEELLEKAYNYHARPGDF
jgi:hypothetical protein